MTSQGFQMFENASYPCFLLDNEGELHSNKAAQEAGPPFCDTKTMMRFLRTAAAELSQSSKACATTLPMLTDALCMRSLTLMPTQAGLLAVAQEEKQAPVSAFSSQMREPLSNIFATLPLLTMHMDDLDLRYTEDIQTNCYQLLRLANNLEWAGHIERENYDLQTVDLASLLETLCYSVEAVSGAQGVPIYRDVATEPIPVQADARMLSAAILNVIRNSLQYTREGNQIRVRLQKVGGKALLTVEDSGLGVRPENLERIFEPYFSVDPYGDSPLRPGLGLGLAVVRETVSGFGGTVNVESKFAQGTRVHVSLPLSEEEEVLSSDSAEYLANRYSQVYIQLCGMCRLPSL